jgi:4-cresol dehydrogenase (hydroxylating)
VLTERTLSCIISLAWDREVPGEDVRAMTTYQDLLGRLSGAGYHSYRLSVSAMGAMGEPGAYSRTLDGIKRLLDPAGILAPGRYVGTRSACSHQDHQNTHPTGTNPNTVSQR